MWLENFQEYFLQIHRLNPCISANVSLVAWLVNGCRTPVTGLLSYGLRWCSPVAVLHVIGTKLDPDLSPFLLSNWLFVCGWLEIFFVSLGLGNLSAHHLGECMLVPLQSPGSCPFSLQAQIFLQVREAVSSSVSLLLSLCHPFSPLELRSFGLLHLWPCLFHLFLLCILRYFSLELSGHQLYSQRDCLLF